jgi:hypothetical protein
LPIFGPLLGINDKIDSGERLLGAGIRLANPILPEASGEAAEIEASLVDDGEKDCSHLFGLHELVAMTTPKDSSNF